MSIEKKICLLIKSQKDLTKKRLSELTDEEISDAGTGFFIKDNLIITAQHVMREGPGESIYAAVEDEMFAVSVMRESSGQVNDQYLDYALCKVDSLPSSHTFNIAYTEPQNGERLLSVGFSRRFKATTSFPYHFSNGTFYLNIIRGMCFDDSGLKTPYGNNFNNGFIMTYEETVPQFPHGMSGGPIVNENYELRGVLSLGFGAEPIIMGCQGLHLYKPLIWIKE